MNQSLRVLVFCVLLLIKIPKKHLLPEFVVNVRCIVVSNLSVLERGMFI